MLAVYLASVDIIWFVLRGAGLRKMARVSGKALQWLRKAQGKISSTAAILLLFKEGQKGSVCSSWGEEVPRTSISLKASHTAPRGQQLG